LISAGSPLVDNAHNSTSLPPRVRLKVTHVQQLFAQAWPGFVGAFVSAVILVLALRNVVTSSWLLFWLLAYTALQVPRYLLVVRFKRDLPTGEAVLPWGRKFSLYTVSTGLIWGATGIVLFPEPSISHQFILAIFVGGIAAAAAVAYSPLTECYLPTVLAILVPFGASYVYRGDELSVTIGTMTVVFATVLVTTGRQMHRANSAALNAAFEKGDLVTSLLREKAKVEGLNRILQAEIEERARAEDRYSRLVNTMNEGVSIQDEEGVLTYVNEQFCRMIGHASDELVGRKLSDFVEETEKGLLQSQWNGEKWGEPARCAICLLHKTGSSVPTLMSAVPVVDKDDGFQGAFAVMTDISDLKRTETRLKQAVSEKEVLLREIHHRVKNNLAVISSLLRLQARHATEEAHRHVLEDARARILSMALAHDKLSASQSTTGVHMDDYMAGLIEDIVCSMAHTSGTINVRKDIQTIFLGLEHAIPLGFIVTELISNALKHAFPEGTSGTIRVIFGSCGADRYQLTVGDDGVGLPENGDLVDHGSLGMKLVKMFVAQLSAEMQIDRQCGTEFRIAFSTDHASPEP